MTRQRCDAMRVTDFLRKTPRRTRWAAVSLLAALPLLAAAADGTDTSAATRTGIVIPIRGEITPILRDTIERRLEQAVRDQSDTVIFEMDTPGGRVDAALDIFRMIDRFAGRTVAWVNPEAYSAGALISAACDEIWMSPSSSIGDCAPILIAPGEGGAEGPSGTLRAKIESPILQKFRAAAGERGYDPLMSRAMVVPEVEVWWVERVDDPNTREFVTPEEKASLIDDVAAEERAWRLVETYTYDGREYDTKQPVVADGELLTMSESEAVAFGFARGVAKTSSQLAEKLGLATPLLTIEASGWETFAIWLNDPVVRGVLLMLVMIGAYTELKSPGLMVPGIVALLALAIFLAAPYAAGLATAWPLVLLGVGLILLAIEIFVLPGFGIPGFLGIVLLLVAIVATFIPTEPDLPPFAVPDLSNVWQGVSLGLQVLVASGAASLLGIYLLIKYLPQSRLATGVLSSNPEGPGLALDEVFPTIAQIGDVGIVTGALRPGGQARFGQEIVDVHSQGEYVEAGRRVQVVRREGMRIVVRPLPDDAEPTS